MVHRLRFLSVLLTGALALSATSAVAQRGERYGNADNRSPSAARHGRGSSQDQARWRKEQAIRDANVARRQKMRAGPTAQQKARWAREAAEDKYRAGKTQTRRNGADARRR
jgi:hypothetical protein